MYTPGILLAYEMCISCKNINIQRVYKVEEEHPPFVSPFEATKTVTPTIRLLVSDLYTNSTQKISFTGLWSYFSALPKFIVKNTVNYVTYQYNFKISMTQDAGNGAKQYFISWSFIHVNIL